MDCAVTLVRVPVGIQPSTNCICVTAGPIFGSYVPPSVSNVFGKPVPALDPMIGISHSPSVAGISGSNGALTPPAGAWIPQIGSETLFSGFIIGDVSLVTALLPEPTGGTRAKGFCSGLAI